MPPSPRYAASRIKGCKLAKPTDTERRLVAIFVADVEGYSRLMGADEVGTLRDLTQRRAILDGQIAFYRGRIANTAGDSVLAEFGSAVDAVRCAVEVQEALAEANAEASADRHINFRIGIHVGDVMVKGGDLFGDGVNIAARLQSLASAGSVCLSGVAHDQVRKILPFTFTDLGAQQVKNIEEPVRAFAVSAKGASAIAAYATASVPLALPDKPSIAVLPFQNISGDPEQDYFADGMVEDIITALSRFTSLFVIARNSTFTYKGKAIDIKQVGRQLGVRYILEGSVRKAGGKVRITGQLIDAIHGSHLWAEKIDGDLESVFDLQDQITERVVGAIGLKLEQAEIERAQRKPTENLDAYDYFLRGMAITEGTTKEVNEEALRLFYKAIEIDSNFASAYALASRCYTLRKTNGWMTDGVQETAETARLARRATALGRDDAVALSKAGYALARVVLEPDEGAAAIERALVLNPHLASAWQFSGLLKAFAGDSEVAIERLARAMRLSPLDPGLHSMQSATALAHLVADRYQEALQWAEKASLEGPNFLPAFRLIAASAGHLGLVDIGAKAVKRMLQIDPSSRVSNLGYHAPLRRSEHLTKYAEGLRMAGLPE